MTTTAENNRRIAKNTLLLYIRMLFIMLVAFYTSRVVLRVLGETDFGIYNVVGGVVAMFGFINGAMSAATQRYLTFELGRNDMSRLRRVFATSFAIHALVGLMVVVLAESVGLWFLCNKMTIPDARMDAARWAYQFFILSSALMIMCVPFTAVIVARERMSAFAYISVLEVVARLLVVFLLQAGDFDRLKLYAALIFVVQIGICATYALYCRRKFAETRCLRSWDKRLFREMLGFSGWSLWGNCAGIAFTQGLNILLNMFFGPAVNAARGVAVQVQAAVTQFSSNFQMAMNPQITKSYAAGNFDYMHALVFRSSKFAFFLLFLLALPIALEAETLLRVWLGTVPDHTAIFLRLILCVTIVDGVANPLMISAAATGRVKVYQSVVGGTLLAIVPISYIALKTGGSPASVFVVHLCVCIIAFVARLMIVRTLIRLSLRRYVGKVVARCLVVGVLSSIVPVALRLVLSGGMGSVVAVCLASVVSVALVAFAIGLNASERVFIVAKIRERINRRS